MSHSSHHHHHSHSSHAYPSHGPPSGYPPSSSHSPYPQSAHHHHHSSRHVSNGPPPTAPGMVGGPHPPPMTMAGPPPEAIGPPSIVAMGNGHGHPAGMGGPISPAARAAKEKMDNLLAQLANANENTWMLIGAVAEGMNNPDRALTAFENALRHNPSSVLGLNAVASIARSRDNFDKAIEYFQRILNINQENGEVWGSMGHCLLMKDDLPKAYTAYQQALYHLPNPKEPKLWYGIGILYDRYGSFEHAEEAFSSVLKMDPNFEKANEIYFRLGIIYKHQRKFGASLECFRYILNNPPRPLTSWDIWFQLGHVYEQDRDYENAREAYLRVLSHQPDHAKVLQQLGWLHHQPGAPFADQDKAVQYLTKSLETDGTDAQSWYLLGRAFMAGQRYNKAYEAYQQAVYRDGRNPTFWCSIGVLYYQINQYRDALDAYSRAIRLNPYISEVWYNLGSLYESCNNQITDAIDAYSRAAELDPSNTTIKQRLSILQTHGNAPLPPAPGPVDVHPSQYSATPTGQHPPGHSPGQSPHGHPGQLQPGEGPAAGRDLPPPPPGSEFGRPQSPGPFRGGPVPPPLAHVDESRGSMSRHAPLAPMETERPDGPRERGEPPRGGPQYNGGGRFDLAGRHIETPPSPGRRDPFGNGPPNHAGYPPSYPRDREHEEWERSRERSRIPPGGPLDVRGPSPRMQDRVPHPNVDPRRQPSPRLPPDYRGQDYSRAGESPYPPGYPYEHRGSYPSGPDPRYDPKREAEEARRRDEGRRFEERELNGSIRHGSVTRDLRADDVRVPSPAPSTGSKAGSKRRNENEKAGNAKRAKDDKPPSKRGSGDSAKKDKSKGSLKATVDEESRGLSPRPTNASSPSASVRSTPQQTPQKPAPTRTVDEDYDEGAADALMTLHGDRPPTSKDSTTRDGSPSSRSPAAPSVVGSKRLEPPSPSSSPATISKKPKGDKSISPPAPTAASSRRTIIEVLNTPSIGSPLPRSTPAEEKEKIDLDAKKLEEPKVEAEPEKEKEKEKDTSTTAAASDEVEKQYGEEEGEVKEASRPPTPPLPPSSPKVSGVAEKDKKSEEANGDVDADVEKGEPEETGTEVETKTAPASEVVEEGETLDEEVSIDQGKKTGMEVDQKEGEKEEDGELKESEEVGEIEVDANEKVKAKEVEA
ncbi:general transcriptional repressor [Kwoniella mangroviensis CBS 10435]|uniref:General transcriptional repressor n=1 Tax=Kwoniella mangroviensis CBS 10435 TaxID=1331196 RepID=A0A1B9IWP8_9TREE|nr:general transcriptional repressor [Kwoniella mangroviensis CBS 10435]